MNVSSVLSSAGIDRADAEILLSTVLKQGRSFLLAHPEHALTTMEQAQWTDACNRRSAGEPVSYIIGEKEFYGRMFFVDRRVLIPRPSTENLVTMALQFLRDPREETRDLEPGIIGTATVLRSCHGVTTVVDIGTGSGCIAITMALERPDLRIIATDISVTALEVAKRNAERHGVTERIAFRSGDLLEPVMDITVPFIIVSNPPYLAAGKPLGDPSILHEPQEALWSGQDGMGHLRRLMKEAVAHPYACAILVESASA